MLPVPIAVQGFKAASRRNSKIVEKLGRVDGEKLGSRPHLNLVRYTLYQIAGKQCCRSLVSEALDHDCEAYRKTVRRTSYPAARMERHLSRGSVLLLRADPKQLYS